MADVGRKAEKNEEGSKRVLRVMRGTQNATVYVKTITEDAKVIQKIFDNPQKTTTLRRKYRTFARKFNTQNQAEPKV